MQDIYYKIGEVAEILGVEQYTLRYLESTLKLKIKRDDRSDRVYTEDDLETLRLILRLKNEKGLNTTAIKMALENMEENKETGLVTPSSGIVNSELVQLGTYASKIIDQNNELLVQNQKMQQQIKNLEEKLSKMEARRTEKLDELVALWRNDQEEKNKSWISKLKRK